MVTLNFNAGEITRDIKSLHIKRSRSSSSIIEAVISIDINYAVLFCLFLNRTIDISQYLTLDKMLM